VVNAVEGETYRLRVTQGTGGSRTLTLPDGTLTPNGGNGAVTLSTTVGRMDELIFGFDGTNLNLISVNLNYTGNGVARKDTMYNETFTSTSRWTFSSNFFVDAPGSTFPACNVSGSSAGNMIVCGGSGTTDTAKLTINTVGYSALTVQWNAVKYSGTGSNTVLEYSVDNTNWVSIAFTDVTANDTWQAIAPISINSAMNGLTTCYLRWSFTDVGFNDILGIDDVIIKGTP